MNTPEVAGLVVLVALGLLAFLSRRNGTLSERARHPRRKHRHETSKKRDGESRRTTQILITIGKNKVKIKNHK